MYLTSVNPEERSSSTTPQYPLRPPAKASARRPDVFKSLRRHSVAATLTALFAFVLGLAALVALGNHYVAESIIYVSPNFPATLSVDHEQEYPYDSYVQQQVHSITRYDVLADALRQLPANAWKHPGESDRAAIERLQKALEIKRLGLTYQVAITLSRSTPDHVADLVNAVTQSYLSKAKDEEFYGRDDRLSVLRNTRNSLRKDLDARIAELDQTTQRLGMAKVDVQTVNPFDGQLVKMREDLTTAHEQRVQAEAQLSALKKNSPSIPNAALNAQADELIANDPGLLAMKQDLAKKRSDLISQLSNLTPNHPMRKQTENQLSQINQALQEMQNDLRRKAAAQLEAKYRAELNRTTTIESKLSDDLRKETTVAKSAGPQLQRAEDLKEEITRLQARYTEVDTRISNLELESSSPGSIHLFSPALPPVGPETSKTRLLIHLLFPFAILLGIAVAVSLDLFDPHIHTASDVEALLGFAPIGVLLDDRDVTQRVFEECSLRLAAGIDHAVRSVGARTFVVTAVAPGAGTTSIVQTLGSTLARLGHKTLTIDAATNTDPVAYVTLGGSDSATKPGETGHFDGPEEIESIPTEALQTAGVFSQPLPPTLSPFNGFASRAFKSLTKEYDVVLIDAAPLLISAETEYLARSADVTLLVAEAGKTKKRQLTRAAQLLEKLDVSGVATVVNKIRMLLAEAEMQRDLKEAETRLAAMGRRWSSYRYPNHSAKSAEQPFSREPENQQSETVDYASTSHYKSH